MNTQNPLQTLDGDQSIVNVLLELNQTHSREFKRAKPARDRHRINHPTEIGWLKCMDGRLHGPSITQTPLGLITPYRAAGARFDLGWPYFMVSVGDHIEYSIRKGVQCLFCCTYHFSKSKPELG